MIVAFGTHLQAYVDGVGFSASGPPLCRAMEENKGLASASKTRREAQHHLTSDFCNKIGPSLPFNEDRFCAAVWG